MRYVLYFLLFIYTELLIWDLLKSALYTIRHCATARAYGKLQKSDVMTQYNDFESAIQDRSKEDVQNGTNK